MSERKNKLCSLKEAAQLIEDGSRIAFGGFAIYQKPMAFVHEMIRAGKRDLTVVGVVNSLEVDMLAGAGCIREIETSYVGLEKYGLARNFRREVEAGNIKVVEYSELLSWDRFRADREGLEFWPATYLGGCDIVNRNPKIVKFDCPVSGRIMWAVPAAKPDVVVVHALAGDKYGNVQMPERQMLPQTIDMTLTRACGKVIVTVDKIMEPEELAKKPHLNFIPAFRTTCIVEVPFGAHPTAVLGAYGTDRQCFEEYIGYTGTKEKFNTYLDQYVYGVDSFEAYLKLQGQEHLNTLRQGELQK